MINPLDYGVSSSNTPAENTSALQAILDAAAVTGARIVFSMGEYHFDGGVSISTSKYIAIEGETVHGCELHFHGTSSGISITYTDAYKPPVVTNLTFITHSAGGGTGLYVCGPNLPTMNIGGPQILYIKARGSDHTTLLEYWNCGIHLQNVWQPIIYRPEVRGAYPVGQSFAAAYGLRCTDVQAPQIREPLIFYCNVSVAGDGSIHGEGLNISGGELVGDFIGIDWHPAVYKPCIAISNIHINAYKLCIGLTNVGQLNGSNIHCYKTQLSTQDWAAAQLSNSHDNTLQLHAYTPGCPPNSGGAANAVVMISSNYNRIDLEAGQWHTPGAGVIFSGTTSHNPWRVQLGGESSKLNLGDQLNYSGTDNPWWGG